MKMGVREAINLAWHYLTKDGTKKSIEKLKADLIKPLPGQSQQVSDELVNAELAMFTRAMQANDQKGKEVKKRGD
jgi:hypothetical protein